ncbi:LysR family transcriptional regulator [Glycomyces sp. TRM65418]|uniref:LysR family transcriptional regulator n=1 Tax=Glycomyces sp. TRM65418 TaxID=2867006 RepID=UPI001CE63968|nr:LysR family transcriptional regulator [Glycomyces sp. TRM65418]MCC3765865.1 LysR family transcriptional regulator [Glycomyces sp. TRM65418]QZD55450.1 LysR family transcriptional regulator [Glycomyces sp. TRM65418]
MDVRHLELLRELALRGSVTEVARATHRTPSAVSQQLKAAQREFGMALAEPSGRGLRLTEAGRVLAEGGSTVATALEQVRARWDSFLGEPSGTVTVAALPSAATFMLAAVMRDIEGSAIELRCSDIDLAEAEFAALAADSDIVIAHSFTGVRPAGAASLTVAPLAREPLDVAMAADHPLAARATVRTDDLVDWEWIGVPKGYPFDSVLESIERATGTALRVSQRIRDNRLVESLVAGSRRIAVLPRFTTPTGTGLVLREIADIPTRRHITAILRPDRAERLAVKRVLDAFRRVAADVERRHRRTEA